MDDEIKVLCPWCDKGEVYIEAGGKGRVSVMCPRCRHCFRVQLEHMTVERAKPHRKLPSNMKTYRVRGAAPPAIAATTRKYITD